ncbi:hypothetical protein A2272_05805 [Candidatus Peregrinibacteria bacterium RIFOXYA12_FULL_33_12]|nr:MAG: hypothetical protein A2272_05805 [Candidatus Peregrinibacteria bacterium RIFOXYA12_FULL_33_12]OGJ50237.1 MAG: hypothetical protein A2307_06650 [Candidatus Peregrinibacteria bacterium RIFOXYB2_FULL_33_20]
MFKTCKNCQQNFEITDDDLKFYEKVSPEFSGRKYLIPPPSLCQECRQQRRLGSCNEFNFYNGKCGICGKFVLTEFSPDIKQIIYCRDCWHSDKWDSRDYGLEFDFSRSFFEQFMEVKMKTPALNLNSQGTNINSEYIHYAGSCKNCYLVRHADFCEDCYYGYGFKNNIFCVDGFYNLHCEFCYDCLDCHKCYELKGSQDCINCSSSAFLRDCIGSKNCFLSVGLRQKEYCFENEQLTKEQYQSKIASINLSSYVIYQACKNRLKELKKNHTFKEYQGYNTENCLGDHLINCKEAQYCFDCEDVETAKFCYQVVLGAKNIYDIYQYGTNLLESYEGAIVGENSYHLLFCNNCHVNSSDLIYCWYAERSKNCFACSNIKGLNYCLLNKQYTKEEYNKLVPKIIDHMMKSDEWGEYFPLSFSTIYGYNKSSAQLYFPFTKDQALAKGFKWSDYEPEFPKVEKIIPANLLPETISEIPDDILNWAIECEVTKKPFKIIKPELEFYRKMNLPIPRRHPDQRHKERMALRNPRKLWTRNCMKCGMEIQTTYSPERKEIVYCEKCYFGSIY